MKMYLILQVLLSYKLIDKEKRIIKLKEAKYTISLNYFGRNKKSIPLEEKEKVFLFKCNVKKF